MNACVSPFVEGIERALGGKGTNLDQTAPGCWSWSVLNGVGHHLEVKLDGPWLGISERPGAGESPTDSEALWELLRQHTTAGLDPKLSLGPMNQPLLRADILLSEEVDLQLRVRGALTAFQSVWDGRPPQSAETAGTDNSTALEQRCEESGWSFVRRPTGRLTVRLESSHGLQASVNCTNRGVCLSVPVVDCHTWRPVCRAAAAALALETAGRIRLVRAAAEDAPARMGFESFFPALPSAEELAAAFAGLSLAAKHAADGLQLLHTENLAGDYLVMRGWSANAKNPKRERSET